MTWKRPTTRRKSPDRAAIVALAVAGSLWGLTVPLSKYGLEWLGGGWLAVARFAIAAPLLALLARGRLRAALTPRVVAAGAVGYGGVILLQNVGIANTSVSHAALIVGAVPVLVAIIVAVLGRGGGVPLTWAGSLLALAGVGLVAGTGGAGTALAGDLLVLRLGHRFGRLHRDPARPARGPRPRRRHRGPARGRRCRLAAVRARVRGRAARSRCRRAGRRGAGARPHRHGARLLAVRLGAGARARGARERVRESRAAGRRAHGRDGVPRHVRAGTAGGRRRDPRRDRARRAAAAPRATGRSPGRRGRTRRWGRHPGASPPTRCRPRRRAPAGLRRRPCPSPPSPGIRSSRARGRARARPRA